MQVNQLVLSGTATRSQARRLVDSPQIAQLPSRLLLVVDVLIEVPVMLYVVAIANRSKGWYERGAVVARVQQKV